MNKTKLMNNSETQRLVQNVILKLEKFCKATSSATALPFKNINFVCDEAFQRLSLSSKHMFWQLRHVLSVSQGKSCESIQV